MNKTYTKILTVLSVVILLSGCAGTYNLIEPPSISFAGRDTGQIRVSYKYDILQSIGNKKYAKKEMKNNIRLVALKITNNTSNPVEYQKDFIILADYNEVYIMSTSDTYNQLKQSVPSYLLYLLLTPLQLYRTETQPNGMITTENIFPIGLILGPGIAAGNMLVSGAANEKFKKELEEYSIFDKSIPAGQTVHAIIATRGSDFRPLKIKRVN